MAGFYKYLIIACLICGLADAQEGTNALHSVAIDEYVETGMEVEGVRVPYYDEEGNLQAVLFGGKAKVLDGGMADITDIRIDLYDDGEVIMTVYAPQCFSRVIEEGAQNVLAVESEGDVLIEMAEMSVVGRGFRFRSDQTRFEILNESKVVVKEETRKAGELNP